MTKDQEQVARHKIIKILYSDEYKNSACAKHGILLLHDVMEKMKADNVRSIDNEVVMQYFQSVFNEKEQYFQSSSNQGVSTQEPKSMPDTAKLSETAVKNLGYRVGKIWYEENIKAYT